MNGTIYRIYIYLTKESYVGATTQDIAFVFGQAKSKLRSKTHPCKPLQEAVNTHGLHATGFKVLETGIGTAEELAQDQERHMKDYKCFNKKVIRKQRKPRLGKEVTWNGKTYPSITAAAQENGLTVRQLRSRIEYGYENDGEFKAYPFEPEKIPCEWEGKNYPSIRAASVATGIPYTRMRQYHYLGITTQAAANNYYKLQRDMENQIQKVRKVKWLREQEEKKLAELERLQQSIKSLKD